MVTTMTHQATTKIIPLVTQAQFERQQRRDRSAHAHLFDVLDAVVDPEIPVVSIWELGILQNIDVTNHNASDRIEVTITPTWSGCPAMQQISADITHALQQAGYPEVSVTQQLAPAWTTDWITKAARDKLRNYGIAPPGEINCPQCGSKNTEMISEFSSAACKSLLRCAECHEPFDQFKTL